MNNNEADGFESIEMKNNQVNESEIMRFEQQQADSPSLVRLSIRL
jgi:hypothetical protein